MTPCRIRFNHSHCLHPPHNPTPPPGIFPSFRTRAFTPLSPSGLEGSWLQGKQKQECREACGHFIETRTSPGQL